MRLAARRHERMDRGETAGRVGRASYTIVVERTPLRPFPSRDPSPITSPPAAPIVDHLQLASYKTINVYRGPRRPVT